MIELLKGFTVAILVANGFQQNEMTVPRKALEAVGATVHLIAPEKYLVQGWDWFIPKAQDAFPVEVNLEDADPANYDALMLPGGFSNDDLRMITKAIDFVEAFAEKPIAAICHGQWLLIDAHIVRGKTVTSWPSIKEDLKNAGATWIDQDVVLDGNLVTSRMPDDLPAFNVAMIELFAQSRTDLY